MHIQYDHRRYKLNKNLNYIANITEIDMYKCEKV